MLSWRILEEGEAESRHTAELCELCDADLAEIFCCTEILMEYYDQNFATDPVPKTAKFRAESPDSIMSMEVHATPAAPAAGWSREDRVL